MLGLEFSGVLEGIDGFATPSPDVPVGRANALSGVADVAGRVVLAMELLPDNGLAAVNARND